MDYNYVGKTLDGRYEIQEVLGVGGMAIVYRAYDNIDDRPVAVKILKEEFLANEEFRRRFKNESKAIAMLSHPNIVKVYDVSYGERLQYIVMEYVEGITLKEYIEQRRVIPWKEAVHFLTQILRALQHAHDRGVVHRDIKPQNIMLLHSGNIKVTDFGIARFSRSETRTMTENAIGSVHYISPEQARGDFTDGKTDIYSLGVVLYEMLTGELPFQSDSTVSVAIMQLQTEPRRPREINDQIPVGLEQITIRAMQKSPAERYQSAAEMLLDLEEFKRNPLIRFEYSYYVDKEPTKYVSPMEQRQRPPRMPVPVPGPEEDEGEESGRSNSVAVMLGVVFGLVGVIALGLVIYFLASGSGKVQVPRFVGMSQQEILNSSEYNDFDIEFVAGKSGDQAVGRVYQQVPTYGTRVDKAGGVVKVTLYYVQASDSKVPDCRGDTIADAEAKIREAGLSSKVISEYSKDVEEGCVIRTDPKEGSTITLGNFVNIYMATSTRPEVDVPDLLTWDVEVAKKMLEGVDLKLDTTVAEIDSTEEKGKIVWQSHEKGTKVQEGTVITVKVSNGIPPTQSFNVDIPLPNRDTEGNLKIYLKGERVKDVNVLLDGGSYTVELSGTGSDVALRADVDGAKIYTATIDFTQSPPKLSDGVKFFSTVVEEEPDDRPTIPSVIGKTQAAAIEVLDTAGFHNVTVESAGWSLLLSGTVSRQSPSGNSHADYEDEIVIYVYD